MCDEMSPMVKQLWETPSTYYKIMSEEIFGRSALHFQELEAETMVNLRPLTYLYDDCTEPELLTPANFLVGRRLLTLPPGKTVSELSTKEFIKRIRN